MLADCPRFYMQEIVASFLKELAQEKDTYRKPPWDSMKKWFETYHLTVKPNGWQDTPQHTIYKHNSF